MHMENIKEALKDKLEDYKNEHTMITEWLENSIKSVETHRKEVKELKEKIEEIENFLEKN